MLSRLWCRLSHRSLWFWDRSRGCRFNFWFGLRSRFRLRFGRCLGLWRYLGLWFRSRGWLGFRLRLRSGFRLRLGNNFRFWFWFRLRLRFWLRCRSRCRGRRRSGWRRVVSYHIV